MDQAVETVRLTGVSKSYLDAAGVDEGVRRLVLDKVDLSLGAGERVAIVGPSGCGKSTLLNIIGTLDRADEGTVELFGEALGDAHEHKLARIRSEEIGFIFQLHHLLPQCTVLENVLVPTLAIRGGVDVKEVSDRARELLGAVGLEGHLTKTPAQLSGGERQRVAVVRALINRPRLVLADEPTGALDEEGAAKLTEILVQLNEVHGVSLMMVTHDMRLAERVGKTHRLHLGKIDGG
ncbi:MAG: ABC transporter ATP-binding protein [Verrucomicrobiota bacterium]